MAELHINKDAFGGGVRDWDDYWMNDCHLLMVV